MLSLGGPERRIRQPGPPAADRITAVPCAAIPIEATLPPGQPLLQALWSLLHDRNLESACLTLRGGAFGPFGYVIPGLSPDGSQAAFYSATFRPPGHTALDIAAVTLGTRDGAPFFHCHALWTEADGRPGCGHVLPDETILAAPVTARGAGIVGAQFRVTPDPETGFSLFMPHPTGTAPPPDATPAIALRLAPNQDLAEALERAASEAGFPRATVQGGVASIIGARFTDAPPMDIFATEILVHQATIDPTHGTTVEITLVDLEGAIATGHLEPGNNPVLMTFEGLLQPI